MQFVICVFDLHQYIILILRSNISVQHGPVNSFCQAHVKNAFWAILAVFLPATCIYTGYTCIYIGIPVYVRELFVNGKQYI